MENSMNQPLSSTKEKVVLYLLGIDKKWVRGGNNQWVEFVEKEVLETVQESVQEETQEAVKKTKKWWQFWKRE
jgi:hypothetical protein